MENWDKIVITDSHSYLGPGSFTNYFSIINTENELLLQNDQDAILKSIDPTLINELFEAFGNNLYDSEDPLKMFNKDSIWMDSQASRIWNNYKKGIKKYPEIVDSFAISCFKNYSANSPLIVNMAKFLFGHSHPVVQIEIISNLDTSRVVGAGYQPYMLPWGTDFGDVYNSRISEIIGKILPTSRHSNKNRLQEKYFESELMERVFNCFVLDYAEINKFKKKHSHKTKRLEKEFEIEQVELGILSSHEWGNVVGSPCAEIILIDSSISSNIQFSIILGRRLLLLHPVSPLLKEKEKILNQLDENPVFKYTIENDSCLGKIHYVNHRSLSGQAKRKFLKEPQPYTQSNFKGEMKDAILYELTEYRNGKVSYSEWLFLKNGSIILCHKYGDFLMNLSRKYWAHSGLYKMEIPISEF